MAALTPEKIIEMLESVIDPALGTVGEVSVSGDTVSVAINVDPARGAALEPLRQKAQAALERLPGVKTAHAVLTAERAAPPQMAAKGRAGGGFSHKISSRPVAPGVRHIVAVASGKGGVGKSTVAANLALAFASMGKTAGLLDADIYGSSQPAMMGLRHKPETGPDDMILPLVAHGIKVMSMGFFVEPQAPVIWRGPMVHSAIQQLLRDVDWGDLDILVIDLPPGTGDAQLSLAQYVPLSGAVIVSTPQAVALSEAEKGLRMFEKTQVPVLGIVENMSYHMCSACGHREETFSHGGAQVMASRLGVPFLGEIPLVRIVREKSDIGTPVVVSSPMHPVAETFKSIAARVWMGLPEKRPQKSA
jgi:ATP-binding protein involved in chromosome partitioning